MIARIVRIIFYTCAILFIMFTWGSMPKSQDDPETIEEAIARMISAHNDDPTAHLGVGQSLENHRANEVIDHPASSILSDKISARQLWYEFELESIDGWSGDGTWYLLNSPGIEISIPAGTAEMLYLTTHPFDAISWMDWSKNPYFEASVYFNGLSGRYREVSWGSPIGDNVLGFRSDGLTLYAVCVINGTDYTEAISGAITTGVKNYRAYVDPPTGTVVYEIDGVKVHELLGLDLEGADNAGLGIVGKRVSGVVDSWAIFHMVMARDI
jgi:hypothetical protein